MRTVKEVLEIPVTGEYDIIVAGGGVAGCSAAVEAARAGKSVLMIEKTVALGGLATTGLVNFFVPMCNGRGKQIIKGMAEELLRLSISVGWSDIPDEWKDGEPKAPTTQRYYARFSAPMFTVALNDWVTQAGVEVLYDTSVVRPLMDGRRCLGIITENKSGTECYLGKMVIDCTGDADILRRSGCPTVQGKNYHSYFVRGVTPATLRAAAESGQLSRLYSGDNATFSGGYASLYGDNHPAGHRFWKGTTGKDVNDYFLENYAQLYAKLMAMPKAERDVLQLPYMPAFRTTCRIDGDYTLKTGDCYRHFEDSISCLNDFDRADYLYEVPYRCLVRSEFPNLITAGRTASGEGYAWDVLRVIPPAIVEGQAAGLAASIAIDSGKDIARIDVRQLQNGLEQQNVMIHYDESLLPEDPDMSGERVDVGHL